MYVCMYKSEIIPNFIHQTQKNLKQQIGSEFLSMEDDEGGTIKAAQVEGGKLEEEDVVQNQSSSSSSSVKGKRPLVENPTSASAPAASGTKSQVEEGAKRPCVEEEKTTKPNHTVKDETEEEEEEQIDYGEDWMKDGGYYLGYDFEKGRTVIVGERPRPVCRSFGPPPPNAFTFKRIAHWLKLDVHFFALTILLVRVHGIRSRSMYQERVFILLFPTLKLDQVPSRLEMDLGNKQQLMLTLRYPLV